MTNPWNNGHRFIYLMSIEMVTFFSFLKKSFKRLLIILPLFFGLLINPISTNALYPSDPSSVDVLKEDLHGKDFCGPPRKGESFVYCTDTVFSESAVSLSKNADLLVHESTFSKEDESMAYEKLHSTTIMAAKTALLSNTKKLIITHFSPRYTNKNAITPSDLLKEAQKVFPNTQLAKDFLTAEIK